MKVVEPCYIRRFSPVKRWNSVEPLAVKAALQDALECWGRPTSIRVDNGTPWGSNGGVPSALALWLAGLGVDVIYGRPAQSTDNAVIERCNGVMAQWVEPESQPNFATCQERLEWAGWTHRERYRSRHHYTRAEAYPDLYTNPRTYCRQHDAQRWQVEGAACFLSHYRFQRKVEKNGRITLMANTYSVGRAFARQMVTIQLDWQTQEWVLCDTYGNEIRRHQSKELDYDLISNFQLAKRRKG